MIDDPFDGEVSPAAVERWLAQFPPAHVSHMERLLRHFRYYSVNRVRQAQAVLHRTLASELGASIQSAVFVPIGYLTSGGASATYLYCSDNGVSLDRLVTRDALRSLGLSGVSAIVFLEDYIGTGRQIELLWHSLSTEIDSVERSVPLFVAACVATSHALRTLSTSTGFRVIAADVVSERDNALGESSVVFPDPLERSEVVAILRQYGERLNPEAPLGYAAPQNLLGFYYSTLSNTLPIFWSATGGWLPLLPHRRQPSDQRGAAPLGPRYSIPGSSVDPDVVQLLIHEFRHADAVLRILPALSGLRLSREMVWRIIECIRRIKHLAHEARPVCVSLSFGAVPPPEDVANILRYLASPPATLDSHDRVLAIAQMVDGFSGALTLDLGGVAGALIAFDTTGVELPFIPSRWQAPARASADSHSLLLTSDGSGRMSVFFNGERLLIHRGATWHVQSAALVDDVASLSRSHGLSVALVRRVLELAMELSDRGDGAMLTVGCADAVLRLADPVTVAKGAVSPTALSDVPNCLLMGPIRQDGASVISEDGVLLSTMRFLRPSADVQIEPEAHWGARHTTAAKVSAAAACLAVTVSSDGAVTAFSRGHVALRLVV